jgi:hypothetical protein
MDNTRNTLETPVWGKPTKRSFYYGLSRELTTENKKFLTDISLASFLFSLSKNNPANLLYDPAHSHHVWPCLYSLRILVWDQAFKTLDISRAPG